MNSGLVRQNGNANEAQIGQGVTSGITAVESEATIIQLSNNNLGAIYPSGTNQSASITQSN